MDSWLDEEKDKWIVGQMDIWKDGEMDRWILDINIDVTVISKWI